VGALLIANHISWIDIAALAYACDVSFVAKRDISSWPIIGMLATRHGCIFIDRGRRSAIPDNAAQISVRLRHGRSVVIFPEGTTGLGWDVLPMKAVVDSSCSTIQPVAISYRNRDGFTQTLDERRSVAWLGDDQLLPHALGLARRGGVIADLWFGPIIPNNSRKELAASAGQAIQHYLDSSFKRPD
jgi:1-acyl-sn-glycerol-3-phosphate acyltransferase